MELRLAVPADALAVARIHVRAWQAGYRGLLPAGYLDGLRAEDRAARYTFGRADGPRTTVAVDAGQVVGFATIHGAELCALHVVGRHGRRARLSPPAVIAAQNRYASRKKPLRPITAGSTVEPIISTWVIAVRLRNSEPIANQSRLNR
jgi:hypothetical protein